MIYREFGTPIDEQSKPSLLGYGCMRFPTKGEEIDEEQSLAQLKAAVDGGVNYFDTAYIYHNSKSEGVLGKFLKTHMKDRPRDSYYIADKLPTWAVETLDDAKRIFNEQLERLGVDYIDFYLLHDLKIDRFEKMEKLGVYDFCRQLQKDGKIKHFGHSSHENIENFTKIVSAREWDFVMLHLNYMDLDNLKLHKLATEKGIPVLVMEGVKGGSLAKLPPDILKHFTAINPDATPASWAIRWAASLPNTKVVLSGMSAMEHVEDNLKTLGDFKPLSEQEQAAIKAVETDLRKRVRNNCTGCNYCMPCPTGVNIPWVFSIWNSYGIYENAGHSKWEFSTVNEENKPKACVECGKCSEICPQEIDIISDLKKAQEELGGLK